MSINRTFMELKHLQSCNNTPAKWGINRTFMELKHVNTNQQKRQRKY